MNSHYLGYHVGQKSNIAVSSTETNEYFSDCIQETGIISHTIPKSTPNMIHPNSSIFPFNMNIHASTCSNPNQQTFVTDDPIERLKFFLATAPTNWDLSETIRRFPLSNGETIACIFWKGQVYITGTDIVKVLLFRFQFIQRPIINTKKFEEGIFSDLRNLKPGLDAALEEPRSEFLELLYRNGCIRTQKKQKVFYWYSVPHERLFVDALERDLKRESNLIHVNAFLGRHQPCFPYQLQHQLPRQSNVAISSQHKPNMLMPMMSVPTMCHNNAIQNNNNNNLFPSLSNNQFFKSTQVIESKQDFGTNSSVTSHSIPPLAGPQPIRPAAGYFANRFEIHTPMELKAQVAKNEDLSPQLNYLSNEHGSAIDDYFGTDLSYLCPSTYNNSYSSNSNSTYATIPDGVVRRPNLFDTFI